LLRSSLSVGIRDLLRPLFRAYPAVAFAVQPAHSHRTDLTRLVSNPFTRRAMRRDLLIGIVIVVLIERARMRPGG